MTISLFGRYILRVPVLRGVDGKNKIEYRARAPFTPGARTVSNGKASRWKGMNDIL